MSEAVVTTPVPTQTTAEAAAPPVPGKTPPAAPGAGTVTEAAKEAARKLKLRDGDQEIEVDEDELKQTYLARKSHQRAANKELQEGKAARKQAEEFISMMKDPSKFYETAKRLGHDPRKLAEEYLVQQLQDEQMDPRDKELRDTKARLKQIEDIEKKQKEALEAKRVDELKTKFAKDYSDQFVSALQESGLPATKPMVAEMAKYISRAAKMNFKMTAQEAAKLVREDIQSAHQKLIGDTDGETLIKLLGEDVANKVRKWDTSRVRTPEQHLKTPAQQGERTPRHKTGERMTPRQWREYNRK